MYSGCVKLIVWLGILAVTIVPHPQKESRAFEQNRRLLVGPGLRQPKPYPGYAGFVGWASIVRTRTGALLVTFSSGYWHASPPTPITGIKAGDIQQWQKMGMPEVNAPRGGRAEIMRSDDNGKTWSDPVPMIDTEWDDRSPADRPTAGRHAGGFVFYVPVHGGGHHSLV